MISCETLEDIRQQIDLIDDQIISRMAARGRLVTRAADFKKNTNDVRASRRVEAIISRVQKQAEAQGLDPVLASQVYRTMIEAFIQAELRTHQHHQDKVQTDPGMVRKATQADIPEILRVQRAAFESVGKACGNMTIAPLTESPEAVATFLAEGVVLVLTEEGRVTGTVRGKVTDDKWCIYRLAVLPEAQSGGRGTRLVNAVEAFREEGQVLTLFTGRGSPASHFYEKLAYRVVREDIMDGVPMVWMEKQVP